jgi:ATP-dependent DNA ligase
MSENAAKFVEPMLLLRTEKLPVGLVRHVGERSDDTSIAGAEIIIVSGSQLHFAGSLYREGAIAIKLQLEQPVGSVLDGEVVALDDGGRPSFNKLQNFASARAPLHFFIFDVLILMGRNVMNEPLIKRRELIEEHVLPTLADPIRYSPILDAPLDALIRSVKDQGLEGLIAKRRSSKYEPGERSGAWQKMRVNRGQELVIGGYTPSAKNFDALIIGYYDGKELMYAARTRNGFIPASRAELFKRIKALEIDECPFANLPEKKAGRWGAGLTAAKMVECRWVKPKLVGQFELLEWTSDNHLRHTRFVGLREDKGAKDVRRE